MSVGREMNTNELYFGDIVVNHDVQIVVHAHISRSKKTVSTIIIFKI